jgi:hypothetical protein
LGASTSLDTSKPEQGEEEVARKSLDARIAELHARKQELAELDTEVKELQAGIIAELVKRNVKTYQTKTGEVTFKVTKVQGHTTIIDEISLKRILGEKQWIKVSTRVLDKKKLEAHIAAGEIDTDEVAQCMHEEDKAPYLRIT